MVAINKRDYTGPVVDSFQWRNTEYAVVPLYRSHRDFYHKGIARWREQFPVRLAYGITIHKAQGMTMPRAVIDLSIGKKDLALFYVAISRVRRLEDIMFEQSFDYDRLVSDETANAAMRTSDWQRRAPQRLLYH